MPRNGSGVYSPDWVNAAPNTTIESAKQNAMVADLVADANAARPVTAGGTAGVTAVEGADNLSTKGANIASAATTDIGAATGRLVHITGTTTITAFGTKTAGVERELVFDGVLVLTHNATSLILPGGANISTAAGDTALMVSEGSGNWRCLAYQAAAGFPNKVASSTDNAVVRFDGTAGQQQSSGVTIDDSNRLSVGLGAAGTPGLSFLGDLNTGFWSPTGDVIALSLGGTERCRWDSSEFIVGATTSAGIANGASANVGAYLGDGIIAAQRNDGPSLNLSRVASTGAVAEFFVSASSVGNIAVTGSATAYNTSSDYRLPWKKGATPLEGSGAFIDALKPYHFPVVGHAGFIAHEFQSVSPSSVTGEKDAVDADGQPIYQAMQASSPDVMAAIIAELQSLRRRVAELEAGQ